VTLTNAVTANRIAISFGGLPGIRREADVLAAIGRPYTGYYRTIERKAAALFQSIACGHGFNDGNKRCAMLLALLLIERSGYSLQPAAARENLVLAF
jgi:death-on-curing protein